MLWQDESERAATAAANAVAGTGLMLSGTKILQASVLVQVQLDFTIEV
jgi:hypothetical protein